MWIGSCYCREFQWDCHFVGDLSNQELASRWCAVSDSKRWQQLFLACGMQHELKRDKLQEITKELVGDKELSTPKKNNRQKPRDPLSPEKSTGHVPARVSQGRAAAFGQPPVQDQTLVPSKRAKAEQGEKDQVIKKPRKFAKLDGEDLALESEEASWKETTQFFIPQFYLVYIVV